MLLTAAGAIAAYAQPTAKATAPVESDLTGYWVSVVTEDWRWRMIPPPKGDYASIPISAEGKRVADTWDPAKDEAAGEQCRSFGAPAILRVPGRLHVTWQNDNTLKVETDAGQQTRLLRFGKWAPPAGPANWQGDTIAAWELAGPGNDEGAPAKRGSLKTVTTHIRPGYLRKNGVPYSANAELTEYWDVNKERDGSQILTVTTIVHDPVYLQHDWITALQFKKEQDSSKWDPQPCSAKW